MSSCVSDWISQIWQLVERDCINSFELLTIFSELLMTLASDWVKFLFFRLSGFCSDFPVLVSNELVWIITKFRLVITSGYFKMWRHTSLILITVSCRCFHFRFSLSFCLLDFIRSNTFGIVQNNCTSDQATITRCRNYAVVVFVNLPNILATIFAWTSWSN